MLENIFCRETCQKVIQGRIKELIQNEDQHWFDHKVSDVRFPKYSGNWHGDVHITYLRTESL
ncbi:hypothetical protein V1503_19605 [Bacillus sp. SCS-151]|uniref:hypothetical protein n=1 Tax=Nanhaiella sioensis TaxID=3115293 RepID=UPI00397E331A